MAGWAIVWTARPEGVDHSRWARMCAAAAQLGETQATVLSKAALVSWRRNRGEFPHSGRLYHRTPATAVAWIGQVLTDDGDASQVAVHLLAETNPDTQAVGRLNGPFAAAVVHEQSGSVTVWTDRHSHYPVYLYRGPSVHVAATDLRVLLPFIEGPRLDRLAVSLLVVCGELIDRFTPLSRVELLPGGTVLRDAGTGPLEQRYWRLTFDPDPKLTPRVAAHEVARRLRQAVRRIERCNPSRIGCPLSGGLDSRLILGLCAHPEEVTSFTWGRPGCRDLQFGGAFACAVGSPYITCAWDTSAFPPLWEEGVTLAGGAMGVHEMFVLPFVSLLAQHCGLILNGLAGDALLGGNFLTRTRLTSRHEEELARNVWRWRVSPSDESRASLLRADFDSAAAAGHWSRSLQGRRQSSPAHDLHAWLFENRVFRFTNCGTTLLRSAVESHAPFFDRDVVDFVARVPLSWKWKHRFYLRTLRVACPTAAKIPWQRTGVPPAWGFAANLAALAFQRAARKVGRRLHFDPFPNLDVADPAAWLRGPWRRPVEEILFDARTLDRGVFVADGVRKVWEDHQAGATCTRQIGAIVTIELFARQFIDQAPCSQTAPSVVGVA